MGDLFGRRPPPWNGDRGRVRGRKGPAQRVKPAPFRWDYTRFGTPAAARPVDETIEITVVKHNGADRGFNVWTLNGEAFSDAAMKPTYTVQEGRRYRLKFRNASADIHPLHLHRSTAAPHSVAGLDGATP